MNTPRIEFAPGHEDKPATDQDVAAKLRLMKAAGQMYDALRGCIEHMEWSTPDGRAAYGAACAALATADGRPLKESA